MEIKKGWRRSPDDCFKSNVVTLLFSISGLVLLTRSEYQALTGAEDSLSKFLFLWVSATKSQADQQGNDSSCVGLKRDLFILTCPRFLEIIVLAVPSNMHTLHWNLQLFAAVAVAEIQFFWSINVEHESFWETLFVTQVYISFTKCYVITSSQASDVINVASGTCFRVPKSVLLIAEAYVVNILFGRTIRKGCEGMGDVCGQKVVSWNRLPISLVGIGMGLLCWGHVRKRCPLVPMAL